MQKITLIPYNIDMRLNDKYTIFGHSGFLGKNIINILKKNKIKYFLPPKKKIKFSHNLGHIIYCIGVYNVLEDPIRSFDASLKILSKIILTNKFKSFTFISSTRLYLNSKKTNENDKICINPNNKDYFFNSIRLAAENFCLSQNNKRIKVVRISNLYGNFFEEQKYFLPNLIRNSIKKKSINLIINKNSKKNYLDVVDAIEIILKIIKTSKYRLYNIASNKRYSLNFISQVIQKHTKCRINYINQKKIYNEPIININRIKKEFNFKSNNNFKESLVKIISSKKTKGT